MAQLTKDTLWKGIIEDLFEDFCHYFLNEWAEKEADFSNKPVFLDKELDELYPELDTQKRFADKLVKVFTRKGDAQWLLLHVEVQGYSDPDFAERMFTYFYRIRDQYGKNIMALALLTDKNAKFQPAEFVYSYYKTQNIYRFETFKLLKKTEAELNLPGNPFSIVMLTAKKALSKRNLSDKAQLTWKRELVLALRDGGYPSEKIRSILHFLRLYVNFKDISAQKAFEETISITFKKRKNMGIEEAILQNVREEGREEGIEETKIKGIGKALSKGKLTVEEIAELFDVSVDFVLKIQHALDSGSN